MSRPSASQPMRIEVDKRDAAIVVRLVGSANMVSSAALGEQLTELIDCNPSRVVLDLSGLEFINSDGLGCIVAAHLRCQHHEIEIVLAAPAPPIIQVLELTRLNKLLPVYDSVDAALTGIR